KGVSVIGLRRSNRPGARIFSTTRPDQWPYAQFLVTGDGVRIRGLRIQGPDTEFKDCELTASSFFGTWYVTGCSSHTRGIHIVGQTNVVIENNEISGWSGAAISIFDVNDGDPQMSRIDRTNASTITIRGNYIHNNQRQSYTEDWISIWDSDGYGVEISKGAPAVSEQNGFEWNRHDIAGDGSPGSGYYAHANLSLADGGLSYVVLGVPVHTHAFDMHGTLNPHSWDAG